MQMKLLSYQVRKANSYLICGKSTSHRRNDFRANCWLRISNTNLCRLRRLNTCPFQGSRTIRTEEAVLISLATISPALAKSARTEKKVVDESQCINFSDESPSDESSDECGGGGRESEDGNGNSSD